MFCEKCGKEMPDDSVNCPSCGANVAAVVLQLDEKEVMVKPQPVIQPAKQKPVSTVDLTKPIGVLGYMVTILLLVIPIVGLVMMFVWAFGRNVNKNKKNLSIALLIFMVIEIVLVFVFGATVFVYITEMVEQLSY